MARFLKYLVLAIILISIIPLASAVTSWNYTASGTWTCPDGVYFVSMSLGSGGGSGMGAFGSPEAVQTGTGGQAGDIRNYTNIPVTPGVVYPVLIGDGGAASVGQSAYASQGSASSIFGKTVLGGLPGVLNLPDGAQTPGGTGESTLFFTDTYIAQNGSVAAYYGIAGRGYSAGGGGGGEYGTTPYTYGTGGKGASGAALIWVNGALGENTPQFSASPLTADIGQVVVFTDLSTIRDTNGLYYTWDFGDGSALFHTAGNVSHAYGYAGSFTPSLTIRSSVTELTETKEGYIVVSPQQYYDPNAPPKTVRFHIQTLWGKALPGATVSAIGMGTSTGNWDWVETLLNIPLSTVGINGTPMVDTTDSNGNIVFLMVPSVKYNITTTLAGYTFPPFYVTPQDTQYNIVADINGTGWWGESGGNTLEQVNISVTSTKLTDDIGQINVLFYDATGATVGGNITIAQDNTTVKGGPDETIAVIPITGSSMNESRNVTVSQEGSAYKVFVNPYGAEGPDIKAIRTFAVWFKGHPISFAGFSPTILLWFSMFLIIFLAMFAGATHAPQMAIILCITSWVLYGMGWLDPIETNMWVGTPVLVFTLGFATVMAIIWNIREGNRRP